MNVILPTVMFLVGFAAGGGILWYLFRHRLEEARERERNVALADLRVANERITSKESEISKLEDKIKTKDELIGILAEEKAKWERAQAVFETSLQKDHEKIDEKIKLLSEAEKQFKDAFRVLAADALKDNNKEFENLSKPVQDTLKEINTKISVVNESAANLGLETCKLVKALQKPEVRGQWGEMHLLRVVEITGMTARCDFHEQHIIGEDRQHRPDLVVHLPGDKNLAVDAKAPIRAFLDAAEAGDDESRQLKHQEFVVHVREHIRLLGSKAYHQSLGNAPEFVVMYLPTEAIFSAALALDADLLEYAAKYRVHLAGPTVLITLLRSVAYGWKQQSLAVHAKEICNLAEELYKRLATFGGHMGKVGLNLNKTVTAYNQAVGSLESRVLPHARRFEQLGAAPDDVRIEVLSQIEAIPKNLQSQELLMIDDEAGLDFSNAGASFGPR